MLDPAKQKKIWDLEHTSFLLETYFGKHFVRALAARDRGRLAGMLHESFSGKVLDPAGAESLAAGPVVERRRSAGRAAATEVGAAAFLEHLTGSFAGFAEFRQPFFKVLFIDLPPEPGGAWPAKISIGAIGRSAGGAPLEQVWNLDAEFRFADEEQVKAGRGTLLRADVTGVVERSSPRILMEEVTRPTGLDALPLIDGWDLPAGSVPGHRYQLAVEDYDRDGWLDIAIGAEDGRPYLLRSIEGRRFENVAAAVGLTPPETSPRSLELHALAGWIDYDNDGWPDLLLGYRLYRNDRGRRFVDVTAGAGLVFDRVPFGCVVADYDRDGRLDLYILYQKGFKGRPEGKRPWVGDPYAGAENHLWRNEGGGRFRNVTAEAGAGGGRHQHFAGAAFFHDGDAAPDLYLANDFGTNVLLRNRGDGTFEDVTTATGTGDYSTSMGVAAGDLDNDGTNELYVANMYSKQGRRVVAHVAPEDYPPGIHAMIVGALAGSRLYRRSPTGRYDELSRELNVNAVGWAYAPAMVDLDGDGWLDLYATAGYNSVDREKPDG